MTDLAIITEEFRPSKKEGLQLGRMDLHYILEKKMNIM